MQFDRSESLYTRAGARKYLTADERRRFLEASKRQTRPELRTLCMTLAYTGARISEALALTSPSIEADAGFIAIRSLKKRKRVVVREIPVPGDLIAALGQAHDLSRRDGDTRLWPMSRSQGWRLVKQVMRDARITPGPHQSPKGLRHGFGLHAISSGVPLNLVKRWLGHARIQTTEIYLQAMGPEERAIAARMWNRTR